MSIVSHKRLIYIHHIKDKIDPNYCICSVVRVSIYLCSQYLRQIILFMEKPLVLQFECKTKDFCFLTSLVPVSTDETMKDCSGDTAAVCTATQLSTGNSATTPIPACECK